MLSKKDLAYFEGHKQTENEEWKKIPQENGNQKKAEVAIPRQIRLEIKNGLKRQKRFIILS